MKGEYGHSIHTWILRTVVLTAVGAVIAFGYVSVVHAQQQDEAADAEAEARVEVEADVRGGSADGNSASDEDEPVRDSDSDDDGLDDGSDDASPRSGGSSAGQADGEAQARDLDDDDDGVSAEEARSAGVTKEIDKASPAAAPTKEIDKASPKLMGRLSIDASSPLLYQGISVRAPEGVCTGEDCDDDDPEIRPDEIELRVSGAGVRGWSDEQKQEARQRVETAGEVTTANELGIRVASAALEHEDVVSIATNRGATAVQYNTTIRLFGFLPVSTTATARAEAGGEAHVSYPWYAFLARKGDESAFTTLAADLRTAHDALVAISVEEEGAPVNRRSDADDEEE